MTKSGNLMCCNQYVSAFGTVDELSNRANQAVVAPGLSPRPKQVSWNVFHRQ